VANGEDLNEHVNDYLDAAKEFDLTSREKFDFFHMIFTGEAKRIYREKVLSSYYERRI